MHRKVILFLIFFALFPVLVAGQGLIKGTITDQETGEALVGVNVIIVGTDFGAATDLSGDYIILNVDPGVYSVKASYIGYQSVEQQGIRVNSNFTAYIDFVLPSEAISTEMVVVTAERPLIRRDATSSVRITNREDIENLPVRGVTNIVSLQAGVIVDTDNDVRIRGSRPDEVGYYLDGINITDIYREDGGRLVSLGNDAIEEIAVETGGFSAEYGGANAGIIRSSLRTGGPKLHASFEYITDNVGFSGSDKFATQTDTRMGAYWYGYNEASFVVGGPIVDNRFKFFYNLNYLFHRTNTQKEFAGMGFGDVTDPGSGDVINLDYPQGIIDNDWDESYIHTATLSMNFSPVTIRLGGTYSTIDDIYGSNGILDISGSDTYNINRNRNAERAQTNGSFSLRLTHVLSPNMFYEVTGGYAMYTREDVDQYLGANFWSYGDSVANANAGAQWDRLDRENNQWAELSAQERRYQSPTLRQLYSWTFSAPNSVPLNYMKSKRENMFFKLNFSWLLGKHHSIKAGGEYTRHTMRNWSSRGQASYARAINIDGISKEKILYLNAVNNYGYDIYGNELNGNQSDFSSSRDGFYAPHKPIIAAAYIQDKMEFSDIILNVGFRFDYIDPDNLRLKDASNPDAGFGNTSQAQGGTLKKEGFELMPSFSAISPRLSVSFPVTDRTVFHASYGKYVQQPSLSTMYTGMHEWAYQLAGGYYFSDPNGMSIAPTRKTHYELGFRQQITDFMAVDISAYYDDVIDEVIYTQIRTMPGSDYQSYASLSNGDFATNKGIEIVFSMRRYHRIAVNANFTFSDAKGTGANPNSNAGMVGAPVDPLIGAYQPSYVSPLPDSKPFVGNFTIDYRFGDNDGGVVLQNMGLNILGRFSSGNPYTRGTGTAINYETDSRFRNPIEALGSSMTPSQFSLDFKLDKSFDLFDILRANIYVRVNNLLNIRAVEQVYSRTGAADDDGYLSNPDVGGKVAETFGQEYIDIYNALKLGYNGYYSDARTIMLGFRLEY